MLLRRVVLVPLFRRANVPTEYCPTPPVMPMQTEVCQCLFASTCRVGGASRLLLVLFFLFFDLVLSPATAACDVEWMPM